MTKRIIGYVCLGLLLSATLAVGQSNTGRLVGTVYDAGGAVIPGASIVMVDNRTKKERSVVSDADGSFRIPLLDIGTYTVTVKVPGFKTYTSNDVVIQVGIESSLAVRLEVGGVDAEISVSAGLVAVNATTSELNTTISMTQIMNLPLNGRNPMGLTLTIPGSSSNSAQNTSISGQRTGFTNITRDGINIQDAFIRSNATDFSPSRPTVDDTEEITITTQNASADQGYGGAQIHLVTPRGSNQYHGGAWDYNRNSLYQANDFFNNRSGITKPFRNRNQFGGKFSGPVPSLNNKVFFFGFYEGLRDVVTSQTTRTLFLPNARNGIFTYKNTAGATSTVNLFSLVPGITAIDPTIKSRLLAPMPTSGDRADIGDQLNTTGITLNQPSNTNRDQVTTRIDYEFTPRQNFNVVYTRNNEVNQRPDINNTEGFFAVHPVDQSSINTQFVAAHRWLPSATFSNEVRGGFFNSDVPFNRKNATPDYFINPGTFVSNSEVTFLPQGRNVHTYNLQDVAEKIVGRHGLKFGGTMQMFHVDPNNYAGIVPTFNTGVNPNTPQLTSAMFPDGISTTQFNNANAMFAMLAGIVSSGSTSFNVKDKTSGFQAVPRLEDYRYADYALYVNDQWRVKPYLSLNLGLRYEILTPPRLLNGLGLEPVIPSGTDVLKAVMDPNGSYNYIGANAGGKNYLSKVDKNNFSPVLSFAYTPKTTHSFLKWIIGDSPDSFVLRGGFRQSFTNDQNLTAARNAMIGNSGLGTTTVNAINSATGTSSLNARLDALPTIAPPALGVPRTYAQNDTAAFNFFGTVFAVDPNLQTTRLNEYNLGIQRSLGWKTVVEARYVGSRSPNLWRVIDYNQIDIRQNGFADDFNRARRNLIANGNPAVGETLTVFPNLGSGGLLTNSTVQTNIRNGVPADLALIYIQNGLTGNVKFLPNPGTGVADVLKNGGKYEYDALQIDLRKQTSSGLFLGANYTWQKTLTDAIGTSQTLVDTLLDLQNPGLEYTRADYDTAHIFNANGVYDLPVGRNKFFLRNAGGAVDRILGGWKISGILRATSGTPITIVDARGTLNRAGRSARQTPTVNMSGDQLKALTGHFENANGVYFINPSVINTTGRGAEGFGTTPFAGQVFFNDAPGTTGNLKRAAIDGPRYVNVDAALVKDIQLKERVSMQLRLDAFNVFNHTQFILGQIQSINSTSFGKMTSDWSPRIVQIAGRLTF